MRSSQQYASRPSFNGRIQIVDQLAEQMFGVSGAGVATLRYMQNGGKRARRSIDQWDRYAMLLLGEGYISGRHACLLTHTIVMDRDRRLTGLLRGQSDNPIAPPGFELNNPWRAEKRMF
ncbi:hypothetical protein RB597_004358 [Gaeumannomyces tritici]